MKKFVLIAFLLISSTTFAEVDIAKSSFTWTGTKVTGKHSGHLSLSKANLEIDKNQRIVNGEFIIDLNTLTVTDLEGEWADKFINHMKSSDFFDIAKFPTAKLVIKEDDGKQIQGNLTIRGKSNPVIIKYDKKNKTYIGTLKFDRTKFDMKYGSGSFFKGLGDKMIHDEVNLDFQVVLK
ncbi:MAG: YceI family protein [Halobacteriovoraceae bacterium]|nr:YceI family protein [Halobacteriovoraceae bacterium]